MIGPAAAALASSATCIATTSSWWAAVKHIHLAAERDRPVLGALEAKTADATKQAVSSGGVEGAVIASGIFRKTDPHVVSNVIRHMRPVRFPAGHVVFAQGDPGGALFMITSGKVKVVYRHTDDREAVLNVLGTSDVFGEVTPFDCGPREVTVTALTEVHAVAIQRHQLLAWMAECPEVIHQIGRLLARRADVMTTCLLDFACPDPRYRVARRLLLLGKRFGRKDGDVVRVVHNLTLDELALFAGVSPQTVGATLRDFTNRGWIRFEDGCLVIVHGQILATMCAEVSCD
jgi:CRP/FNR family transcriptional regulator, cyclic AMP receptor protein